MSQAIAGQAPDGTKAQRVYLLLRDRILAGQLAAGDALPGELRLAELHGVSRVTIRRALDGLVADGLVERRVGSGTVVCAPAAPPGQIIADFATLIPQLRRMGEETTARLLAFSYDLPPAPIAAALGLADGARVQRAVRLRLSGGLPFSHLTTHVPERIAQGYSEADLATTPLFRLLEQRGVVLDHARQAVSAILAPPDVAQALEVVVGAPLIALTRVVYDDRGNGVEHLTALYRPDRFSLEMMLARVGEADARHWAPVPANPAKMAS
ncbi:GntR family transcriptional regulator [Gemmobacter sp.]|uniref:GntR family transcriptional regulator n=1 Tax=Gemmobacter sp. TaxID=1898957 RepID=UPI002B002FF0|nr:GntR family transcriptional regulator [Gemmobacter sp.]